MKNTLLIITCLLYVSQVNAQQNIALQAVSTHSGGGATDYGPQNYNDGIIPPYNCAPTPCGWGWVTTNGWIEYTWTTPQLFNGVKFYKDNRPMSTCTFQYWNGSAYVNFFTYNSSVIPEDSIFFSPVTSTKIRFNTVGGANNPNFREIEVYSASTATNDAGVTAITSPVNFCPNSSLPITVTIQNFGKNQITSVNVNYEINGLPQGSVPYIGTLDTFGGLGPSFTSIVLTPSYFFTSVPHIIKAWTSLPNGSTDTVAVNDTATRVLQPALSGAFTVGGTGADFPNLSAAVAAMSAGGVCGPVVLNVDSASGPYTGQVSFTGITGASATNTITVNGNGAVIQHAGTTADIAIVKLSGANYVKLDRLNIRSTGATTTTGILFTNNSNYNTIENCVIDMSASTTLAATVVGIAFTGSITATTTAGSTGSFDTIRNNRIIGSATGGAYYGITLTGTTGTGCTGNVIENNLIEDFYAYGVYALNATNNLVSRNEMSKPNRTAQITFAGVFLSTACAGNIVERNRIHNPCGGAPLSTSALYPIYLSGADAPIGNENRIYNNLIYNITGNGTVYGIYNTGGDGMHAYYNTISLDNTAATAGITRGFFQTTAATNIEFRNNIISITRGGTGVKYAVFYATPGSSILSNNNCLYVNSAGTGTQGIGTFGTAASADLLSWQAANGGVYDQNSVVSDPAYLNPATFVLIPSSGTANNIGTPIPGITTDFDGVTRNATNPDPGAYEFSPVGTDLAFVSATAPSSGCDLTANETAVVRFQNAGANAVTGFEVGYILNGGAPVTTTYAGSLPSGSQDSVVFTGIDMSAAQAHSMQFFISLTGDGNLFNDSSSVFTATSTASQPSPTILNPNVTVCSGSSALLSATGTGTVTWYSNPQLTQVVATGNNVLSGPLTSATTFYAANDIGITGYVGAPNNNIGTTNTSALTNHFMIFDVFQPMKLNSVLMISTNSGSLTVELQNSAQTVIATTTVAIVPGSNRYQIGFDLMPGTGYRMRVSNFGGALVYRNETGASYPYTLPGMVSITGNTFNPVFYYYFYDWEVSTGTGCPGVAPVDVSIAPVAPTPDFIYTVNNNVVQFTNLTNSGATYSWDFGDATTSTAANPTKTYSSTGFYFVTLTASNACVSNSQSAPQIVDIITMGIDDKLRSSTFEIFPNPSKGAFSILVPDELIGAEITIHNLHGMIVKTMPKFHQGKIELELNNFPAGIYLIKVSKGDSQISKKLFLE